MQRIKSVRCTSYTKRGKRCKNRIVSLLDCACHHHRNKHSSREESLECPVCYENLEPDVIKQICGHRVHQLCLTQHFKPECPVCRHPLNIKVTGTKPLPLDDIPDFDDPYQDYTEEDYYQDDSEYDFIDEQNLIKYVMIVAQTWNRSVYI